MSLEQVQFGSLWIKDIGEFTNDYALLAPEESGFADQTLTAPGSSITHGRDAKSKFIELVDVDEAPGDPDSGSVEFYAQYDAIHALEKYQQQQQQFYIQRLSFATPPVDVRSLATKALFARAKITGGTDGAGPNRDGSGGLRENTVAIQLLEKVVADLGISLNGITNAATEDALSIVVVTDDLDRSTGYPGPDKIIYIGLDDDTSDPGEIWYSNDGLATLSVIAADADPFVEVSGINALVYQIISATQLRLLSSRTTDAGEKAMFAYQDITFGAEGTVASWNVITIAATAVADAVEAMLWPQAARLYIAAAGDIYLSTGLGETDPGSAIFTGSNTINQFFYDFERNVWAVGATNTILVELANARGTFVARTGPSGGGDFTALARAKNGIIFGGNGQKLYRNTNKALNAGGWSESKDFGTGFTVKKIVCVNGSSEIVRVVVSDANDGQVWFTLNGGINWTQIAESVNNGYNAAATSEIDHNKMFTAGDIDTNPVIEKLS